MSTLPAVAESTYRHTFRGEAPMLPTIHYKTFPCMHPGSNTRKVSQANKEKTDGVVRAIAQTRIPSADERSSMRIPLTSTKVFDTKFGPMDMETVDRLYNKIRYETYTSKAAKEYTLPMYRPVPPTITKEEKPDLVTVKGQRYDNSREEWQDAALWDRIQSRAPTVRPKTPARDKLLHRRQKTVSLKPSVESHILDLVKKDELANVFVMKCPGYAGYAPLCPPETRLNDKEPDSVQMTSLMRATYRHFSTEEYMPLHYARKGPLSKTVTLTYPYNPYNKVGDEVNSPADKEGMFYGLYHWLL